MKVLFLIRGGEVPAEKRDELMKQWNAYTDELGKRGVLRGGLPVSGGKVVTTSGAVDYTPSTMDVTGYMELEVDSIENAIKAAEMAPNVAYGGSIEIRPEMPM